MQEGGCRSTPVLGGAPAQAERGRLLPGPRGQGLVRSEMPPSVWRALGRETPRGQLPTSRSCPGPRPYGRGRRGSGLTLRCPRRPPPWGPRPHPAPSVCVAGKPPAHSSLEEGVGPPTQLQSSGPSSQGRGISWPLPEACRALAGGEKDTLHCPADPRTPARAFRFPGCFRPPSAHSVSPRRRTSGAVPALSPLGRHSRAFRVCRGPVTFGGGWRGSLLTEGGLWLLLPTHVAARRPRCCPSRVIGRTAAPTAAGLTGESEMRK